MDSIKHKNAKWEVVFDDERPKVFNTYKEAAQYYLVRHNQRYDDFKICTGIRYKYSKYVIIKCPDWEVLNGGEGKELEVIIKTLNDLRAKWCKNG